FIPPPEGPGLYGWSGVMTGAAIVFFAYIGFDAVSTAAQEAKNPQKDMPIGIIGSLLICTVLYILVSGIATGIVPYRELNVPDPIAIAPDRAGLGWMATLIKPGAGAGLPDPVGLVRRAGRSRLGVVPDVPPGGDDLGTTWDMVRGRDGRLLHLWCPTLEAGVESLEGVEQQCGR